MLVRHLLTALALAVAAAVLQVGTVEAQRAGGYELEYEGAVMGGATGIGARTAVQGGRLLIDLPATGRSQPTIRFVRRTGAPDRPAQISVGDGGGEFEVEFTHPQLPERYIGEAGMIRITEISDGRIRGDFVVAASPASAPGSRTLTFRGRFDASGGR